jgi:hypothetical protein
MKPGGERDHFFGDVDPNNRRPTVGSPRSDIARPRCHIEKSDTAAATDRLKQRLDKPTGDLTKEAVVTGRLSVPTRQLKRRERIQVDPYASSGRSIVRPRWTEKATRRRETSPVPLVTARSPGPVFRNDP